MAADTITNDKAFTEQKLQAVDLTTAENEESPSALSSSSLSPPSSEQQQQEDDQQPQPASIESERGGSEENTRSCNQEDQGAVAATVAAAVASVALQDTAVNTISKHRPTPIQTGKANTEAEHVDGDGNNAGDIEPPGPTPPPKNTNMADYLTPPTPGVLPMADPNYRRQLEEDERQEQASQSNTFTPVNIDLKRVKANTLSPREQEAADETMAQGISALFNNKFSHAKGIFESHAHEDVLHSLGLGSMAFLKAITSANPRDAEVAIASLTETYQFAQAQIEAAQAKKPLKDTVSHMFTNLMGSNTTGLPTNTRPLSQDQLKQRPTFMPNGALRAHIIKAECGLLMSMVHMSQETVLGYLKMGLNLRRAYSSYSLVWQEYKRMGQDFHKYIDENTVSAIQFGIGSVHLLLSSLPPKILKIVSAFGWNADKHLGFALLKLCLEGRRIRAPLASMMLLSYYVILTSHAPLILNRELMQPAVDCLLDAQKTHPSSAFFLYFAGRVSRLTRSISLSTQSFDYTSDVSKGEWAEVSMGLLASYEIAFNSAMELQWEDAAQQLEALIPTHTKPAFIKYFYGVCMEMMGNRSEAILAFAEAPKLVSGNGSQLEQFIISRVNFFERSGYQDLDFVLPALEILLLWNSLANMSDEALEVCLDKVDETLNRIYDREKREYEIRTVEIAPNIAPPDYYDQRATLLLIKSSILNALSRGREAIPHLNWILDNRKRILHTKWIVPFAYWESGVTCWCMEEHGRARSLWEAALSFSGYPLEYRLAIRLNLAITHANDLGILASETPRPEKGISTNGRKRLSLASKMSPPDSPDLGNGNSHSDHPKVESPPPTPTTTST
ncbi:hypothetical protein BDB00DRAFT_803535 [Zychaea mexicana]|uniref:uncharacterized protein n=1 Tax=Zychaea mexicana TaxID=64656 RepID=UPI0022FF1EE9|nr:uncharacterized protein BDB00DRAFT_803535 [Zychaea mexicana]KAI9497667.1 hypothetical protein BDB00DRAFT_803535 [Zychaea mexicana]